MTEDEQLHRAREIVETEGGDQGLTARVEEILDEEGLSEIFDDPRGLDEMTPENQMDRESMHLATDKAAAMMLFKSQGVRNEQDAENFKNSRFGVLLSETLKQEGNATQGEDLYEESNEFIKPVPGDREGTELKMRTTRTGSGKTMYYGYEQGIVGQEGYPARLMARYRYDQGVPRTEVIIQNARDQVYHMSFRETADGWKSVDGFSSESKDSLDIQNVIEMQNDVGFDTEIIDPPITVEELIDKLGFEPIE